MGPIISTELSTGKKTVLVEPKPDDESTKAHEEAELRRKRKLQRSIEAQELVIAQLKTLDIANDATLHAKIADAENLLDDLQEEMLLDKPVELHGSLKHCYDNEWKLHRDKLAKLELHRGQAFSMILGQCTPTLKEQMKADGSYSTVMENRDPLALKLLMERTIYSRQETKYPYETLFEQIHSVYGAQQHQLSDDQFYERMNTRIDVAESLGLSFIHSTTLDFESQRLFNQDYDKCDDDQKDKATEAASECMKTYLMLRVSGHSHSILKDDLGADYTRASAADRYKVYPTT